MECFAVKNEADLWVDMERAPKQESRMYDKIQSGYEIYIYEYACSYTHKLSYEQNISGKIHLKPKFLPKFYQ